MIMELAIAMMIIINAIAENKNPNLKKQNTNKSQISIFKFQTKYFLIGWRLRTWKLGIGYWKLFGVCLLNFGI